MKKKPGKPESIYESIEKPVALNEEYSQKLRAHPEVGHCVMLVNAMQHAHALADALAEKRPTTNSVEFSGRIRKHANELKRLLHELNETGGNVDDAAALAVEALALGSDVEAALADARWTGAVRERLNRKDGYKPVPSDEEITAALSKYKKKKDAAVVLHTSPRSLRRWEKKRPR